MLCSNGLFLCRMRAKRQHAGLQSTGARDVRANLGPNICPRSLYGEGLSRHGAACSHIHHSNIQAGLAHEHSCATWCHERNRHWCETERCLAYHSLDCSNDRGGAAGMATSVSGSSWAAGRPACKPGRENHEHLEHPLELWARVRGSLGRGLLFLCVRSGDLINWCILAHDCYDLEKWGPHVCRAVWGPGRGLGSCQAAREPPHTDRHQAHRTILARASEPNGPSAPRGLNGARIGEAQNPGPRATDEET